MGANTSKGEGKRELAEKRLKKALESGDRDSMAKSYIELGDICKSSRDTVNAEQYYEKALEFAGTEDERGRLLLNLAAINLEQLDYDQTLEHGYEGIAIFERLKDVKSLIDTYKIVTKVFTRTKQTEKALESVKMMIKATGIENESEYEIARVYHSLKDYNSALKHFLRADELGLEESLSANVNNYIGRIYLKKMKPELAYKYLEKAYGSRDLLKGLEYRFAHANMGAYYHLMKDLDNARKFYDEALQLFLKAGNLAYINFFLSDIYRIEPRIAFEYAVKNPLGIAWLLEINQQQSFQSKSSEFWKLLASASGTWWQEYRDKKNDSLFQHWKIKQLNQNIAAKITSESVLNFVLGANNLSTSDLHDEEEGLPPSWFVELPSVIHHGEKYLKIRLNNLVQRGQEFKGYPSSPDNDEFTPVDRIVVSLRTQWLQETTFDHVFMPNTEDEWEASRKTTEAIWLKDCFVMDLGEHSTSEDQLELTCQVNIYFDRNSQEPDVKTTNRHLVLPIHRKNRYQIIQKYKKNNENALTVMVALTSLLGSLYVFITGPTFETIRLAIQEEFPGSYLLVLLGLGGGLLVIIALVLHYFLRKEIKREE
ncbi:MAG: tetratricopeptide repeat protein [Candidatus Odinarchaeota archaeon]